VFTSPCNRHVTQFRFSLRPSDYEGSLGWQTEMCKSKVRRRDTLREQMLL